ncbi:heavy metal-associated isoprenylated plant protein 33-like [Abrus precatorius]|uniref:Heavy metal-associated isoprenylated plant protein 33-like n=1 Tax=Abrus precatorius TaxID=3816 RepID=A0A8B8LV65_ABRPR|nr:heavy metal-associated isoprenylated plant protein 33-like [Abrus precatorius]
MAKEVDFKNIELKVSANCCEGCKRKVKKALRNTEGVLNIYIDPLQPKITVLGNVNPHILIKKLLKVGKRAELCSYEKVEAEKEEEKEKQDTVCEQQKHPHGCDIKIEKIKDVTKGGKRKSSEEDNKMTSNTPNPQEMKKDPFLPPHQEVNFMVHPSMHPYSNIKNHPQYCYIVQPSPVAIPYYAIPSYSAPPLPQAKASVEEYYHFDMPRFQPPFLRPTVQVGDYFSDENTMGCHVM